MDKVRISATRNRRLRYVVLAAAVVAVLSAVTLSLSRLKPAVPSVESGKLWVDTAKRGPMLRQVRATGTLVPETERWMTANTDGYVENLLVQPGAEVTVGTLLLVLTNPELHQSAQDVAYQVKAAEAELANLRVKLESEKMSQQAAAATVEATYREAKLTAEADQALAKKGLIPALNVRISSVKADELETRLRLEKERLNINQRSAVAQLAAQQARLDQLRAQARLKQSQVASLQVRATLAGVLQQLPVEVGQRVNTGANLAKIAEPSSLKAVLKVAETQAKDVQRGQRVSIDTRNGIIQGQVARIDPAVQADRTVTVDVALEGPMPGGVRPDLSVEGTVEIEKLDNVLYIGRGAVAQEQSTVEIFRVTPDGASAERVQVKLGRSSANTIEVTDGLQEGDQVILSDMSSFNSNERVRLK
ncbi:MAG TPA: efflux RND transporter periplasmic adaptor subunit [Pyrinomonadaceae bacterium]|nr:efflux RND transporter periplasmic adaptor subunit [Pyrinomonadaceae bacterium]